MNLQEGEGPKSRRCKNPNCKNEAAPNRLVCHPCKYQAEKARDSQRTAYHRLKSRAKERNIFFDLTLEEFREFCIETDILAKRGRKSSSWTIDRIIEELGYTKGNLQKLTNAENVAKENRRRKVLKFDSELYHRRRVGYTYESQEEYEALDGGRNTIRYFTDEPKQDEEEPPF